MTEFAKKLKELRKEKELTILELGKLVGISDATICRWENNKCDIKSQELVILAKFFNVSTDYLLGLED